VSSCGNSCQSLSTAIHLSLMVSDRGSSHVSLVRHISCNRILALTVTGVAHPNGSKIYDEVCSMSLLVTKVLIGGNCLAASDRMSVAVFQRRPSKLTVVFGSQVLSWLVITTIG